MQKASFEGSATVEMAYIMPFFLSLFLLIVTAVFYFHDKSVLYASAYETALAGAQAEREGEGGDEELSAFFRKRTKDKLLFFPDAEITVKKNLEYITVTVRAKKGKWSISAEQKAMLIRTEEEIYLFDALGEKQQGE